jgi:hypothetical protein
MHCGRDTTVGVNPIPPKQYRVCTLAVDDEERSRDRLAAVRITGVSDPRGGGGE